MFVLTKKKDKIWKELRSSSMKIWEYHKEFKDDDRKLKKQILGSIIVSSKILIKYGGCMGSGSNRVGHIKLLRGSTDIFIGDQGATSSQARSSSSCMQSQTYSISAFGGEFLDSPSTTSAVTYGFRVRHDSGSTRNIYINRSDDDGNQVYVPRPCTTLKLMEVSA